MTPSCGTPERIVRMARARLRAARAQTRLDGWFLFCEKRMENDRLYSYAAPAERSAQSYLNALRELPLTLDENALFAGDLSDAFARSNPLLRPELEPLGPFARALAAQMPCAAIPIGRIEHLRAYAGGVPDVRRALDAPFLPMFAPILKDGIHPTMDALRAELRQPGNEARRDSLRGMLLSLSGVPLLAGRYMAIAGEQLRAAKGLRRAQLLRMSSALGSVSDCGAKSLYQAIQLFLLLYQALALMGAPNPVGLSPGALDQLFEPYREADGLSREETSALLSHLLVFFNVGDKGWAAGQVLTLSGRDGLRRDLTNETTYAMLEAARQINALHPLLAVRLHAQSPDALFDALAQHLYGGHCALLLSDDAFSERLLAQGAPLGACASAGAAGGAWPVAAGYRIDRALSLDDCPQDDDAALLIEHLSAAVRDLQRQAKIVPLAQVFYDPRSIPAVELSGLNAAAVRLKTDPTRLALRIERGLQQSLPNLRVLWREPTPAQAACLETRNALFPNGASGADLRAFWAAHSSEACLPLCVATEPITPGARLPKGRLTPVIWGLVCVDYADLPLKRRFPWP